MELRQHLIHRTYHKAEAKNQIILSEDYSVPEGKPDVSKILQKKAEMKMDEVHTEKGKIKIRGSIKIQVLYLTEHSAQAVASLEMEHPLDEILYLEDAVSGDRLKIDWNMEELQVGIVHPGKLSVRGILNLWAGILGEEEHRLTEHVEDEIQIHTKTGMIRIAEPVIERKDSYRIREEVVLPANQPNVQTLLWKDLQLRGLEIRLQEGQLAIKGEVLLLVVYEGEEDNASLQCVEQTLPFHGILEAAGVTPEMFGILEPEIARQEIEVKPDYDGEMRVFQVEVMLDIPMHIYEEKTCAILKDAYSTKEQLNLQQEDVFFEKLRVCNTVKCRVSGKESVEGDAARLQVIGHHAQLIKNNTQMTDQGILKEGLLQVQVLFASGQDQQPMRGSGVLVPYRQLIEIPEMSKSDRWNVTERIEQLEIRVQEGGQVTVRAVISMDACVLELCKMQNIVSVTKEAYSAETYKKRPGMVIHFVQPGETLWKLAKDYRTTTEEIKKSNELTAEEVLPGQKLLLMKEAEEVLF